MPASASRTFDIHVGCPDAFRTAAERRAYTGDQIDWLPTDFPELSLPGERGGKAPAIIELRGICREVAPADTNGVIKCVWSIYAGPSHKNIDSKMQEESKIKALLEPLLQAMMMAGAWKDSHWRLRFSDVKVDQGNGPEPIIEVNFAQQPMFMIKQANAAVMAALWEVPTIYNALMEGLENDHPLLKAIYRFATTGRLALPERWHPPGYQSDPWWDDAEIFASLDSLVRKHGMDVATKLWDALLQDDDMNHQVRATGMFNEIVVVKTRVYERPRGQAAPAGANKTRLLRASNTPRGTK